MGLGEIRECSKERWNCAEHWALRARRHPQGRHAGAGRGGGEAQRRAAAARRLRYLDGLAFREGPFLRLLMLFYGNLLGLLITENRPTFKNKSNVSNGWTHTQWLSKTKNKIFCKHPKMTIFTTLPFGQGQGLTVTKNLLYSPSLAMKLYMSAASWSWREKARH